MREWMEVEQGRPGLNPEQARQAIERATNRKARGADKKKARHLKDLALVIGLTLASAVLFALFDALEGFYAWTRKWERWEFDDIFLSVVVLAVCLVWFSYRQWKETLLEIAEREQIEEALHESEERWRRLVESHPEPILISIKGEITYTNEAGVKVFGASFPEALLGRSILDFPTPELHETFRERLALIERGEPTPPLEHKITRLDGEECYIESFSVPIVYRGQQAAQTVIRDVTARKQAEEALQQFADRLETLRQIDQAILAARSPEAIAEAALTHIRKLVPCWRVSVTMFDREAHEARLIAVHVDGETRIGVGKQLSLGDMAGLESMRQGQLNAVEDIRTLSQLAPVVQALQAEGLRSYVSVPLMAQGELMGTLHLASDSPGFFSKDEIEIAREVADSLGVVLQSVRLFEDLHTAHERLQSLSRQLVDVQEAERRHLAHELHDEIGQVLTAVRMNLQAAQQLPEATTRIPTLEEGIGAVDRALEQIRALLLDLRPALLDSLGLVPAIRWYVDRQAQQAEFTVRVATDAFEERLPPTLEITCFRVVQEALTNVMRHAQAGQVQVELQNRETEVELVVRDDGVGFDVEAAMEQAEQGTSLGLLSMQERVRLVGGWFKIIAAPGRGTEIRARFPVLTGEHGEERRAS